MRSAPPHTSLRVAWPALAALALALLVEMIDNSILNVALPAIGRQLAADATALQWVNGAYALTFGGFLLTAGSVADRWGRRRVMLAGLAVFGLGSLLVLVVRTPWELVAVRALVGVGAAMLAPGTMAMTYRLFGEDDDALRMRALSLISTVGLVGMAAGPAVGGLALAVVPWQGLLLVNLPLAAFSIAGVLFGIPADTADGLHDAPLDLPGAVACVAALAALLGGLSVGVDAGWSTPATLALLALGAVAVVAFVLRERAARHPMLDPTLLRIPAVGGGVAVMAGLMLPMIAVGFVQTLHLQYAWGWSAFSAGLGTLPRILTMVAMAPIVDRVVTPLGRRASGLLSAALLVGGTAAYALLARYGVAWMSIGIVVSTAGTRILMTVAAMSVMSGLPRNRTSLGASLSDTSQEIGASVGLALAGTVLAGMLDNMLPTGAWGATTVGRFENAETAACLVATAVSALLVFWGAARLPGRTAGPQSPARKEDDCAPTPSG